jgi:hypothetical protein
MHVLVDNLAATLIGVTGLMLITAIFFMRAETAGDSVRNYATVQIQEDFVEFVESDLLNAGTGRPIGEPAILTSTDSKFAFYSVANPNTGQAGVIEYRKVPTTDASGTRFRIDRYVDGTFTGGGPDMVVSRFDIELLRDSNTQLEAGQSHLARRIRVRMEWEAPHQGTSSHRDTVQRRSWTRTFSPPNLSN